jgi:signal peptidase II
LIGTSLVLAGGASNWVDRLVRGSVVDFLNIGVGPLRTGIVNVADMTIMLGVAVLLLAQRRRSDDVQTTGDSSGQTA